MTHFTTYSYFDHWIKQTLLVYLLLKDRNLHAASFLPRGIKHGGWLSGSCVGVARYPVVSLFRLHGQVKNSHEVWKMQRQRTWQFPVLPLLWNATLATANSRSSTPTATGYLATSTQEPLSHPPCLMPRGKNEAAEFELGSRVGLSLSYFYISDLCACLVITYLCRVLQVLL